MASTLRQRLVQMLGKRKVAKYFPSTVVGSEPETGDLDLLDEIVAEGLRQLAETVPITATESMALTSGALSVSPIGPGAPRRLAVESIIGSSNDLPYYIGPVDISYEDGFPKATDGWELINGQVRLKYCGSYVPFQQSPLTVVFRVVPTESEITANVTYMRAAAIYAVCAAHERILTSAMREHTIRIEGAPDVRDNSFSNQREIDALRDFANNLVGTYMAVS